MGTSQNKYLTTNYSGNIKIKNKKICIKYREQSIHYKFKKSIKHFSKTCSCVTFTKLWSTWGLFFTKFTNKQTIALC